MKNKHEKHSKVWGEEEWIINTADYCGKILRLNKGYCSSYHYHKEKDETFLLLDGKLRMKIAGKNLILEPGESVRLKPNTIHEFEGLENSTIIEFSTQHSEDDVYRETESRKVG